MCIGNMMKVLAAQNQTKMWLDNLNREGVWQVKVGGTKSEHLFQPAEG